VGKKTAERLIIEMRDKVEDLVDVTQVSAETGVAPAGVGRSSLNEAVEALRALGYKPADAEKMIRQVESTGGQEMNAAGLIKKALQASVTR
jgi:Holliday junction DNA helicase RuvA